MRVFALVLVVAAALAAVPTALAADSAAAAQPQQAGCALVSASVGAVDVTALVVAVHVDPVAANVRLEGLLGTLLCPILGGLGGVPAPAAP